MACMAAVAGASAVTAAVSGASVSRCSTTSCTASSSPLLFKRTVFGGALRSSNVQKRGSLRFQPLVVRAASDDTTDPAKQLDDVVGDLKAKWEAIENKSTVAVYGGGALVALWLSSTIVGAINSVPLLPKLMELIGLGYTGWFVYRYLLFKSSRKELVEDIEELKGKITGATSSVTGESDKSL